MHLCTYSYLITRTVIILKVLKSIKIQEIRTEKSKITNKARILLKKRDYQEFQAAAKAKIRQLNLMVMEVYDEGRVLACFGSCPATSYSKLVLDWLGLNLTADQPVVALDGFVQTQRLQQLKNKEDFTYILKIFFSNFIVKF